MAVSAAYLTKIRRAVRIQTDTDMDAELTDIIEECRLTSSAWAYLQEIQRTKRTVSYWGLSVLLQGGNSGLNESDAESTRRLHDPTRRVKTA